MSENEDDTRSDELERETPHVDPRDDEEEGADEEPQPWAKLSSGDADDA